MMINSSGRAISVSRRTAEVYVSCKDAPRPSAISTAENRRPTRGAGIAHEVKCEDDLHAAAIGADHLGIGQKAEQEEISPCEPQGYE